MDRRAVVRPLMFGALVTGLVPLTSAGVGGAAAVESPAVLCSSTFGAGGPGDGPVVGEGPPGDPMPVTIAWNPADWPHGLRDVVTCLSVDGRAVPSLATAQGAPRNSGTFNFNLTLPAGEPGAVVCQRSVLVGSGSAGDRRDPTDAMCFKLRAAEPPPAEQSGGSTIGDGPATPPARTGPGTPPARAYHGTPPARTYAGIPAEAALPAVGRPAPAPPAAVSSAPAASAAAGAPPAAVPAGRPPAGPAKPAARPAPADPAGPGASPSANRRVPITRTPAHLLPGAWSSPSGRGALGPISRPSRGSKAAARAAAPDGVATPPARAAFEAALDPDRSSAARGGRSAHATAAPAASARTTEATEGMTGGAPGAPGDTAAPRGALARTGITDRVPLAAAGTLLAFGGAAIVLAEPRRRARPARAR